MAFTLPIVILVLLLIATIGIFIFARKVFKYLIIAWLALLIFSVVLGFMVFKDVNDLRENFPYQDKIILLDLDGDIATGFIFDDFEKLFPTDENDPINEKPLSERLTLPNLDAANSYYKENDLDSILGDNYKLLIIKSDVLESLESVDISEDITLSKSEVFSILKSETPKDEVIDILFPDASEIERSALYSQFNEMFGSDKYLKIILFVMSLANVQQNEDPIFIFEQFKDGNIIIHKETITFKLLKYFPMETINNIAQKFMPEVE